MNGGITISVFQFLEIFPDKEQARTYLEKQRWGGNVVCPHCGSGDKITTRKGNRLGYYRCRGSGEEFTVRTGTIFERSHVPLNKWLYAIYIVVRTPGGVSSLDLSKELSVTQSTAWFILGRLREACNGDLGKLSGVVELEETIVGGKSKNKHKSTRLDAGRGMDSKTPLMGARQRKGKAKPVTGTDTPSLQGFVAEYRGSSFNRLHERLLGLQGHGGH